MTENTRPIVTAVGRRLRSKHGEPQVPPLVICKGETMTAKTAVLDPGAYDMPEPWPRRDGSRFLEVAWAGGWHTQTTCRADGSRLRKPEAA